MTKEEALAILQEPIEDFKVGETVYYAQYEPEVIPVIITAKRESRIGLKPCYSLYNKKLNKTIHTPLCYIYSDVKDAIKCWEALKLLREED